MTIDHKLDKRLALVLAFMTSACTLIGVEPDEIDLITGETGDEQGGEGETSGGGEEDDSATDSATGTDSDSGTDGTGDGDGDDPATSSGDGDGDPSTGDGDGDPSGDGDGDPTGNPEPLPCVDFVAGELVVGDNPIDVGDGVSYLNPGDDECALAGPDQIYSFQAAAGSYGFTLSSDQFEGSPYLVDGDFCAPVFFSDYTCEGEDVQLSFELMADQTLYVIVDTDVPGMGTLNISAL